MAYRNTFPQGGGWVVLMVGSLQMSSWADLREESAPNVGLLCLCIDFEIVSPPREAKVDVNILTPDPSPPQCCWDGQCK